MSSGGLERKLLVAVLGMFLLPTVVVEAILIMLYRAEVFRDALTLLLTVLVGLAGLMGYLAWVAYSLGRTLVGALEAVRHGTELMASVNPDHRLEVRSGGDLDALSRDVNRLADHARDARLDLEARVASATHALEAERAALAAVVGELAEAVVVAALDGRISLANRAAQTLLSGGAALLGRSLFELVDRECIASRLVRLGSGSSACEEFTLRLPQKLEAWASMTAFRNGDGRLAGFILTLRQGVGRPGAAAPGLAGTARFEPRLIGAGLRSGVEGDTPSPPRSELYDFSLLAEVERPVTREELERELAGLVFVVLDVETTGLAPESGDRIVSLAGVRVRGGVVRTSETFDALVQPERPIPPRSTRLHGITEAMVTLAPPIEVVLPAFMRFAEQSVLVGHEVSFDLGFLARDAARLGLEPLAASHLVLDTRRLCRLVHGRGADLSLEAVARRLGVAIQGRHSALGDALATAEVLVRLLALLDRRQIRTVRQVLTALREAR